MGEKPEIFIFDLDDIREFIHEQYEEGERPKVSVPRKFAKSLQKGLEAHTSWIPNVTILAGTMSRDVYIPEGEDRVIVEVVDIQEEQIHPRFTGDDHAFHGVVVLEGPIPKEAIHIIN